MIEKYEVVDSESGYSVVKGTNILVNRVVFESSAKFIAAKLNRLAALEAVCREIVAGTATRPTQWEIAQKLKAVLEEA